MGAPLDLHPSFHVSLRGSTTYFLLLAIFTRAKYAKIATQIYNMLVSYSCAIHFLFFFDCLITLTVLF